MVGVLGICYLYETITNCKVVMAGLEVNVQSVVLILDGNSEPVAQTHEGEKYIGGEKFRFVTNFDFIQCLTTEISPLVRTYI